MYHELYGLHLCYCLPIYKAFNPVVPTLTCRLYPWRRFGTLLEFANTMIPYRKEELKRSLLRICNIPRMSTLVIGALINKRVSEMCDGEVFVNVGVWHGFTLLSGMVNNARKRCIGIDNFSEFGNPKHSFLKRFIAYKKPRHFFYEMDYLDYFSSVHRGKIGFYIYDGYHDYTNQLHSLAVAEPFFSENAIILIDDINYVEARKAATNTKSCWM